MPGLFDPLQVRGVTLRNRVVMAPMDQLAAVDGGSAGDWHVVHYGSRAVGGVGLIFTEVTAVEPRGVIYPVNLGLWDDAQIEPLRRIAAFCASQGAVIGIQLGHAGRKAYYDERGHSGHRLVAPSRLRFDAGWRVPMSLAVSEIRDVVEAFAAAARRAVVAGFQAIEIHAAHGYLLSEFFSPLTNRRDDEYGGSIEKRSRMPCEVVAAVRAAIPDWMPISVRISGTDFVDGGNTADDMAIGAACLREAGADLIHVSAGGVTPSVPKVYPGYLLPAAETIRRVAGGPVIAVGLIENARMADEVVGSGCADLVALGRELLRNPYWALHAAAELGVDVPWPGTYIQAKPKPTAG